MSDLKSHVSAAVEALCASPSFPVDVPADRLAAALHARLWPHVEEAVGTYLAGRDLPAPGRADRRARPWQYVARFWDASGELIGETDPAIIQGTGELPGVAQRLMEELHEGVAFSDMQETIKARLPQLRNNLGRADNSVMRIPYRVEERDFLCQLEVYRLA
jgi:hypothetical protein